MKKCLLFLYLSFGFICGCSPNSSDDFHHEGESFCHALRNDLKKIHTREDLQRVAPDLKKKFNSLVDLIIASRIYQQKHPNEEAPEFNDSEETASMLLLEELQRIYTLEGGREVVENAQREALIRLDGFERNLEHQKQIFSPNIP